MPGWVLVPNPGHRVQAPPCLPPVCRVGTTLRSTPTPGRWATAWSPLRTQCSGAVRSSSRRQPTRRDRHFLRPETSPQAARAPWPWCRMVPAPLPWPGTPAARPGSVRRLPPAAGSWWLAPSCTPTALAPAAACTSEQNGFLSTLEAACVIVRDSRPAFLSQPGSGAAGRVRTCENVITNIKVPNKARRQFCPSGYGRSRGCDRHLFARWQGLAQVTQEARRVVWGALPQPRNPHRQASLGQAESQLRVYCQCSEGREPGGGGGRPREGV